VQCAFGAAGAATDEAGAVATVIYIVRDGVRFVCACGRMYVEMLWMQTDEAAVILISSCN
jgi:hypothetical protein